MTKKKKTLRCNRIGVMPSALTSFKGGRLSAENKQIDNRFAAYTAAFEPIISEEQWEHCKQY